MTWTRWLSIRSLFDSLRRALIAVVVGVLIGALIGGCAEAPIFTPMDVANNDIGVAQMGQYEYATAEKTFAGVVDSAPRWLDARVNLAVATLNRQEEGDEHLALDILASVLTEDGQHLRALYTSGILRLYLGEAETAVTFLSQVVEADPLDGYAAYFLGQAHLQLADYPQAARWLVLATELDPYLRSAYWAGAQALRREDKIDQARELLDLYQRFEPNPAARLADFAYKRMGPKAEALAVSVEQLASTEIPAGTLFAETRPLGELSGIADVTTADINQDGRLDLLVSRESGNVIWLGADEGFERVDGHPLSASSSRSALWGDIDDDGIVDVIFCSSVGIEYWRQVAIGDWVPTSMDVDTSQPCTAGALFDADHDGDLDVFTTGTEGAELYSNNRDGTFRLLGQERGIRGGAGRQVVVTDLDGDRDLDMVVVNTEAPHDIWQNDRTWQYQPFPGLQALSDVDLLAVTAADVDADGHVELLSVQDNGALVLWDVFDATQRQVADLGPTPTASLAVADINGNSELEVVVATDSTLLVLSLADGSSLFEKAVPNLTSAIALPLSPKRGPSLLAVSSDGLSIQPPGPGRYDFMTLAPTGRSEADQMRSNASGIGTRINVRVGGRWVVLNSLDTHSGPGQSLAPIAVGLNGQAMADFVALEWSDGVTQSEIGLASGQLHEISETQRQLASCPVLFVWDGSQYRFVSDVLGVGGMGFLTAPGTYAQPRPFEVFLFEQNVLAPKNGRYHIKLTEPMEENAYVDAAMLRVFDVPVGWSLVIDERMAANEPEPSGAPIFYRESFDPVRAWSNVAEDVTDLITVHDLHAPSPGETDSRFVGLLRDKQVVTIEFADAIDREGVTLVADGWVEYGYSQTVFAAWQAGQEYQPVTLEARDGLGQWHVVAKDFGYPAGMPRQMVLPLPQLPLETRALRLSSNMEIYWDRVQVVMAERLPSAQVFDINPIAARVAKPGFAQRTNGPQRVPDYDYSRRSPYWDTKFQRGYYTALGDALELVDTRDGAVAIIGGGEEIHFEFATPPPAQPGFERFIAIEFRGWAKDMDLYTEHGDTVGPLPVLHGLSDTLLERRDTLHRHYNVRFQEGF